MLKTLFHMKEGSPKFRWIIQFADYNSALHSVSMSSTMCLMSDAQVDAVAAFNITGGLNLHDPWFGDAGSTEIVCPTYGMRGDVCMGHHASLSRGQPVFQYLLYKQSQMIINSVCLACKSPLERVTKSKAKRCSNCDVNCDVVDNVNHGDFVIYADDMSAAARPSDRAVRLANSIGPAGRVGHIQSSRSSDPRENSRRHGMVHGYQEAVRTAGSHRQKKLATCAWHILK